MKSIVAHTFIVACLLTLVGCTYAYNQRTVNSPDWKYGVTCYVRGSYGRSYVADTKKMVVVWVNSLAPDAKERVEKERKQVYQPGVWVSFPDYLPGAIVIRDDPCLFTNTSWIKGSDVEWTAEWGNEDDVVISFYDYGARAAVPYALQKQAPTRSLRTIHLTFDKISKAYKEVPLTDEK